MKISELNIVKSCIAPEQTIWDFLKLNLYAVPIVENYRPIGYITITHIFEELLPKEVIDHAEAIGKKAGRLEFSHNNSLKRIADLPVRDHCDPLSATVEYDDPTVKAASEMIEYNMPIIAVTKNNEYLGFIDQKEIARYLATLLD